MIELLHGNCLDLLPQIEEKSIDMIFADLPFGVTQQNWDEVIDLKSLWNQYLRVIKDDGAILLFAKPPFDKLLANSKLSIYRYDWIWEKTRATGHLNANKMPLQAHENICVFYKKQPVYTPQKTDGHKAVNKFYTRKSGKCYGSADKVGSGGGSTERFPRTVLKYPPVANKERRHSNQKPLPLLTHLIKTYSNAGDTILDNTMGSGSTGEACLMTGRKFIGMELEEATFISAKKHLFGIQGELKANSNTVERFSFGAIKAAKIKTSKTEYQIKSAIRNMKQTEQRITKAAVARIVGISREQLSRRYSHLFRCDVSCDKNSVSLDS